MKKFAAVAIALLVLVPAISAQGVSGKWTGAFTATGPDGGERDEKIELNLVQKGKELTGTAGPNAEKQWPVSKGVIDGTKLTFQVQSDGPLVSFTLALVDGRLKGDAVAEQDGQKFTAKVDAARAK